MITLISFCKPDIKKSNNAKLNDNVTLQLSPKDITNVNDDYVKFTIQSFFLDRYLVYIQANKTILILNKPVWS